MATPEILNFEKLLQPISSENPGGIELKQDSKGLIAFHLVKTARDAARSNERLVVTAEKEPAANAGKPVDSKDPAKESVAQWKKVFDESQRILRDMSKDLWIAAWLIESLTRLHGFAGLRDGFRLTRELCEKFWDGIHPVPDDEGYVTTVTQLAGLNGIDSDGALIAPIASIPFAILKSGDLLTGMDFHYALEASGKGVDKAVQESKRIAIEQASRETPREDLTNLREDVEASLREFELLTKCLDVKCGQFEGRPAAPPSSQIQKQLQASLERVCRLLGQTPGAAAEVPAEGNQAAATGSPKSGAVIGETHNREDALRSLMTVAAFFRRTEPHSPVSYALEQVVRWGRMSLPELLRELISDDSTKSDLEKRTGIPMQPPESNDR